MPRKITFPVSALRRPFGDWMWFVADADGKPLAQIMPSSDEHTARELATLINAGHAALTSTPATVTPTTTNQPTTPTSTATPTVTPATLLGIPT